MSKKQVSGLSLLELVIVMVLLGISATGIMSLFTNVGVGLKSSQDIQTGTKLAQELAEQVMADRRNKLKGYLYAIDQPANYPDAVVSGFQRKLRVTALGAGSGSCPVMSECSRMEVVVSRDGVLVSSLSFLLINY